MIETARRSTAEDLAEGDGAEPGTAGAEPVCVVRRGPVSPWLRPDRMRGAVLVATLSTVGATLLVTVVTFVAGHLHIAVSWR